MQSNTLIRWSGAALALSGLFIAVNLFHPNGNDPLSLTNPAWTPVHLVLGLGMLLYLPGLTGLYAKQAPVMGRLGFIGFVMAFLGTAILAGPTLTVEAYVIPSIASVPTAAPLLDPSGPLSTGPLA